MDFKRVKSSLFTDATYTLTLQEASATKSRDLFAYLYDYISPFLEGVSDNLHIIEELFNGYKVKLNRIQYDISYLGTEVEGSQTATSNPYDAFIEIYLWKNKTGFYRQSSENAYNSPWGNPNDTDAGVKATLRSQMMDEMFRSPYTKRVQLHAQNRSYSFSMHPHWFSYEGASQSRVSGQTAGRWMATTAPVPLQAGATSTTSKHTNPTSWGGQCAMMRALSGKVGGYVADFTVDVKIERRIYFIVWYN